MKKNAKLGQKGREAVTWLTFEILAPSISWQWLELETLNSARQRRMPISVTISRWNRNRKY